MVSHNDLAETISYHTKCGGISVHVFQRIPYRSVSAFVFISSALSCFCFVPVCVMASTSVVKDEPVLKKPPPHVVQQMLLRGMSLQGLRDKYGYLMNSEPKQNVWS